MNKWSRLQYQPNIPLYKGKERVTESSEHITLSKNAAKEGMVLLKNDHKVLPLAKGSKVALFGKGTIDYVKGGGGSGDVSVSYIRNLYDGFCELSDYVSVFEDTISFYKKDVEEKYAKGQVPGMLEEPELPDELVKKARAFTDTAIISISRFSGEGWDRKAEGTGDVLKYDDPLGKEAERLFERSDFYLTSKEEAMVKKVEKSFKHVIVVLNVGGMVASGWFHDDDKIEGALLAWQGGMEGGLAAAELIAGIGNPSGKLADTFARDLTDYPSTKGFHESMDYVDYTEDIYVGYRYFSTIPGAKDKVLYPFGFGLSYTTFDIEDIYTDFVNNEEDDWLCAYPLNSVAVTNDGDADKEPTAVVNCTVVNTGNCAGREVMQVYVSAPSGKLGKPSRVLCGYKKTNLLEPGMMQHITISFPWSQVASYDDLSKIAKSCYVLEKGVYGIYLGNSVEDAELVCEMELDKDVIVRKLTKKLAPVALKKRMLSDGSFEELELSEVPDKDAIMLEPNPLKYDGVTPEVRHVEPQRLWGEFKRPLMLSQVASGEVTMRDFLAQLSDFDLASLLGGQPNTGVGNTFGFGNLPEYGVPNAMTADGPAGLRIQKEVGVNTTAFPCATLLACTWDPDVTMKVGMAAGEEVKENNLGVWLSPAINIHRSPLCGRNFEYYSEDPFLTGKQAAALVRGVQSNRIGVSLKHFALNNKETNRKESDSRASERAIREIYLKAFEIVVKESDPWTVMSSYNVINGVRSAENKELLTDILRDEWGFKGMVTTDWWGYSEQYKEIIAGNDVKMGLGFPKRLVEAKEKGLISRDEMEISASRVLELILKLD